MTEGQKEISLFVMLKLTVLGCHVLFVAVHKRKKVGTFNVIKI
jgi:hypothetical protein